MTLAVSTYKNTSPVQLIMGYVGDFPPSRARIWEIVTRFNQHYPSKVSQTDHAQAVKESKRIMQQVLGYPPSYQKVRDAVCAAMGFSPLVFFQGTAFRVAFASTCIEDIYIDARLIAIGEAHDGAASQDACRKATAALITSQAHPIEKNALLGEGFPHSKASTLTMKSAIAESSTTALTPAIYDSLSMYGWDQWISPQYHLALLQEKEGTLKPAEFRKQWDAISTAGNLSQQTVTRGELYEEFPKRTASMITSFNSVHQQMKEGSLTGRAFLVAGLRHVVEEDVILDCRLFLGDLYAALNTMPAVVLYPDVMHQFHPGIEGLHE